MRNKNCAPISLAPYRILPARKTGSCQTKEQHVDASKPALRREGNVSVCIVVVLELLLQVALVWVSCVRQSRTGARVVGALRDPHHYSCHTSNACENRENIEDEDFFLVASTPHLKKVQSLTKVLIQLLDGPLCRPTRADTLVLHGDLSAKPVCG